MNKPGTDQSALREWRRMTASEMHERLRHAYLARFVPPVGASKAALEIAESKLLREVSSALIFVLEGIAEDDSKCSVTNITVNNSVSRD